MRVRTVSLVIVLLVAGVATPVYPVGVASAHEYSCTVGDGETIKVTDDTSTTDDSIEINNAIENASDGDVILLDPAVSQWDINSGGAINVTENVTLDIGGATIMGDGTTVNGKPIEVKTHHSTYMNGTVDDGDGWSPFQWNDPTRKVNILNNTSVPVGGSGRKVEMQASDNVDYHSPPVASGDIEVHSGSVTRYSSSIDAFSCGNAPPNPDAGSDISASVGESVELDASATTDPEGDSLTYDWDTDGDGDAEYTGSSTSHSFDSAGTYNVTLNVSDPHPNHATDVVTVEVVSSSSDSTDSTLPVVYLFDSEAAGAYATESTAVKSASIEDSSAGDSRTLGIDLYYNDSSAANETTAIHLGNVSLAHDTTIDAKLMDSTGVPVSEPRNVSVRLNTTADTLVYWGQVPMQKAELGNVTVDETQNDTVIYTESDADGDVPVRVVKNPTPIDSVWHEVNGVLYDLGVISAEG